MSMKSSRSRLVPTSGNLVVSSMQKMPRVHTSPRCMGCGVARSMVHVGDLFWRFRDWAMSRYQTPPEPPPGAGLLYGSVSTFLLAVMYATSTLLGSSIAIAGKKCVLESVFTLYGAPM